MYNPKMAILRSALATVLLLTGAGAAWAQELSSASAAAVFAPQTFGLSLPLDAGANAAGKAARQTAAERAGLALDRVPEVHLAPVDRGKLLAEDAAAPLPGMTKLLRIGVGRELDLAAVDGAWLDLPGGGRRWAVEVVGDGAEGLRLGFSRLALPAGAELTVQAPAGAKAGGRPGGEDAVEWIEAGALDAVRPKALAAPAPVYWSQVVFGPRARVELYLPARAAARFEGELPFTLDRAQYLYRDPLRDAANKVDACHNDVTCYALWAATASGVARFSFIDSGASFLCTGQLLNDLAADYTPYFLTANHCVSTNAAASSAVFFWLYQSAVCDGEPPAADSVRQSRVARFLAGSAESDFSLLLIEGRIPNIGLSWVGWNAGPVADGTDIACIHHPSGDYKRISFGTAASNPVCGGAHHFRVNWTSGVTEPGSSGSGAFRRWSKQLVGQLHCGPSACGSVTNDSFGSFSFTYPRIASLLAAGSDDSLEPDDACAAPHAVTAGQSTNLVVKKLDEDWYQTSVPAGKTLKVTLSFVSGFGDLDLTAFTSCDGAPVGQTAVALGSRVLSFTNTGAAGPVLWRVSLANGVRNVYHMKVEIL